MKKYEAYVPVSCDFVDQIEILATKREKVEITYLDQNDQKCQLMDILKTWETKDKIEYLITQAGQRIRLDRVIKINGYQNSGNCTY